MQRLSTALRTINSLRMQATSAIFLGLPAVNRRRPRRELAGLDQPVRPLSCSLVGKKMRVFVKLGSLAHVPTS